MEITQTLASRQSDSNEILFPKPNHLPHTEILQDRIPRWASLYSGVPVHNWFLLVDVESSRILRSISLSSFGDKNINSDKKIVNLALERI